MTRPEIDHDAVDRALSAWRQGDCVLGPAWFLLRADPDSPLSEDAADGMDSETGNFEVEVTGFAVLTQTCDLVRTCRARPYVEVAPLIAITEDAWRLATRGRLPRYVAVPALEAQHLAIDLDRVMTVEKPVVVGWQRISGFPTAPETRALAHALARKRARFAFPDDFVALAQPLIKRLHEKHDRQSDEGTSLRALREIRVHANPSWDADAIQITFLFVRDEAPPTDVPSPWHDHLKRWLALVPDAGRFQVHGYVATLDDLTVRDYVESDALDLEHLTTRRP